MRRVPLKLDGGGNKVVKIRYLTALSLNQEEKLLLSLKTPYKQEKP